jgi:hypothetical protein
MGLPGDIGSVVAFLASDDSAYMTAAVLFVDDDDLKRIRRNIADNRTHDMTGYDNEVLLGLLQQVTDDVFFIPGVDRTQVMSLYTPNVRFTEVVEDGISGGNVIPDDFEFDPVG